MTSRISIIILNWNGWLNTIECLESLYQISYSNYEVILIDNGSKDGSLEEIRTYLEGKKIVASKFFEYSLDNKPILVSDYTKAQADSEGDRGCEMADLPANRKLILIRNDKNYGFAEGNNIAIKYALTALNSEYILLLNNDTVVKVDFLDELIKAIECDQSFGFAGPIIYYYDYNGQKDIINVAGIDLIIKRGLYHRFGAGEIDRGQYNTIRVVDYLEGSCLLIKSAVLDKIGLFDSRYFAYWEETDLCIRGRDAGYKCICVPTAKIWHKVSSSAPKGLKLYYMTRNRFWFVKDHATRQELQSFLLYFFTRQFWIILRDNIYKKDMDGILIFLKGVLHGILPKR